MPFNMRTELLRPLIIALAACAALSACSSAGGGRYPINLDVPAVIATPVPDNPPPVAAGWAFGVKPALSPAETL